MRAPRCNAQVQAGMEHLLAITEVGDMAPWGMGPVSSRITSDPTFYTAFPGNYLSAGYSHIDYFTSCDVMSE